MTNRRIALWLDFAALYIGVPLIVLRFRQLLLLAAVLWLAAYGMHLLLRSQHRMSATAQWNAPGFRSGATAMLTRFLVLASFLTFGVWHFAPQLFLTLLRQHPGVWLLLLALYPILSVWPQEVIYRNFQFHRYGPVFRDSSGYIAASGLRSATCMSSSSIGSRLR